MYLAGKVVRFPVDYGRWTDDPREDGATGMVWIEHIVILTGRCYSHHKKWVKVRTRRSTYQLPAEDVVAYYAE